MLSLTRAQVQSLVRELKPPQVAWGGKRKKRKESKTSSEKFDFMLKIEMKTFLQDQIAISSPEKMNSNSLIPLNAQALFKFI